MDDGAFGFAHLIFHLVLVAVLHGSRAPQGLKRRREPMKAGRRINFAAVKRRAETKTDKRKEIP